MYDFNSIPVLTSIKQCGFINLFILYILKWVVSKAVNNREHSNNPPVAVVKLLNLLKNDLSHLGREWIGFRFIDGHLVTPEDYFVTPGKIRAYKYLKMTIDFRAEENTRLKQEIDCLNSRHQKPFYTTGKIFHRSSRGHAVSLDHPHIAQYPTSYNVYYVKLKV